MKTAKLYKVMIGINEKGEDVENWSSQNVVALDVSEAIKKTKLPKNGYVQSVEHIASVDVR